MQYVVSTWTAANSNHNSLPAPHPTRGLEFRNTKWFDQWLGVLPKAAKGTFLTRLIKVPQVRKITGNEIGHPLIQVVHACVVKELKTVPAGLALVGL
jgi:hypothetical protein